MLVSFVYPDGSRHEFAIPSQSTLTRTSEKLKRLVFEGESEKAWRNRLWASIYAELKKFNIRASFKIYINRHGEDELIGGFHAVTG